KFFDGEKVFSPEAINSPEPEGGQKVLGSRLGELFKRLFGIVGGALEIKASAQKEERVLLSLSEIPGGKLSRGRGKQFDGAVIVSLVEQGFSFGQGTPGPFLPEVEAKVADKNQAGPGL